VAEDQVGRAGADAVTVDARLRGLRKPRVGGEAKVIIGTKGDVINAVDRDARPLRRGQQAPRAAQALRFARREVGGQFGMQ
jgi:hypothetical protein